MLNSSAEFRFAPPQLDKLIQLLAERDYEVVGPTVRDGAVIYDRIGGIRDLAYGVTDEQDAGRYRLKRREDGAFFGYANGPQSWKKFLHPTQVKLFDAEQKDGVFRILPTPGERRRFAFIGVRACDLAAIGIQDRVMLGGPYADPIYQRRRDQTFVVAVQCTRSVSTCFCASMGTGPQVRDPAVDLTLTEMADTHDHWFLAEAGTERGREVLALLDRQPASELDHGAASEAVESAARAQTRRMDTTGIRDLLYQNFEHPRWDNVAERCLSCANCTMVCPTCFCTTIEDTTDVTADHAERWRLWDSCFSLNFSYIHGGSVRASGKARYRQWMTHKLASWIDQFGSSGCVGCGRCIAWCPVGIDITEEVQAIRANPNHNHGNTES